MRRYYRFAGLNICIHGDDSIMYKDEKNLALFREKSLKNCEHFYFTLVDKLIDEKGILQVKDASFADYEHEDTTIRYVGSIQNSCENAYMRIENDKHKHYVSIKRDSIKDTIPVHTVFTALNTESLLAENNGIMMHASYIEDHGEAILFTAPSGTGKSTQADLWEKCRKAKIINGDRVAIVKKEDTFYACGVPFSGSSNICKNVDLPIKAIVYLEQAPKTSIRQCHGLEAFVCLYAGSGIHTWDKDHVEFASDFIDTLMHKIPIYKLKCTPDESAIIALEEMWEDQ